jgi:hypothetical protein
VLASLTARLAAHGLTLRAERHEVPGYTGQWRLDGLGTVARFGTLEQVERWAAAHLRSTAETRQEPICGTERQEAA